VCAWRDTKGLRRAARFHRCWRICSWTIRTRSWNGAGTPCCRYADDCNIYVRSKAAGERVLASLTQFLEGVLRLRVNRDKSAAAYIEEREFLGYRLLSGGRPGIAPKSLDRAKDRVRRITCRNRGVSVGQMVSELNSFLTGWVTYFRLAACKTSLIELDGWLRRKLRCVRLKHCKRTKTLADFFRSHGVSERTSWVTALSGKGWWRLAGNPAAQQAMDPRWFESLGLVNLARKYATLQS
jgi:RNA-directed DNA polymerase